MQGLEFDCSPTVYLRALMNNCKDLHDSSHLEACDWRKAVQVSFMTAYHMLLKSK